MIFALKMDVTFFYGTPGRFLTGHYPSISCGAP
jgi:hypothetical protein